MKRSSSSSNMSGNMKKHTDSKKGDYVGDPKLVPRVKQYLQDHKGPVSIAAMTDALMNKYAEYKRKKRVAFFRCVEKAWDNVTIASSKCDIEEGGDAYSKEELKYLQNKKSKWDEQAKEDSDSDDAKSFSSDNLDYVSYKDTDAMNSFMKGLYKKTPKNKSYSQPPSASASPQRLLDSDDMEVDIDPLIFKIDRAGDRSLGMRVHSAPPSPRVNPTERIDSIIKDNLNKKQVTKPERERGKRDNMGRGDSSGKMETPKTPANESLDDSKLKTPATKKRRKEDKEVKKKGPEVQISSTKFCDIGGNDATLKEVCKLLVHMKHPEVYQQLGVTPPRGFLLHGPPGCGKTLLAHAIAGELELPFIKMAATEVVSGVSGESEEKLRDVFDKALSSAPCVLFIDEIDAITQKRETASKDMERRIVSQLLTCMDDLNNNVDAHVLVIGATNRADSLDPALRRAGRFDREISLGIPDENARMRILEVLCRDLRLAPGFDLLHLARNCPGFVGADLRSLAREAAIVAVNRVFQLLQSEKKSVARQQLFSDEPNDTEVIPNENIQSSLPQNTDVMNSNSLTNPCESDTPKVVPSASDNENLLENGISHTEIASHSNVNKEIECSDDVIVSENNINVDDKSIKSDNVENKETLETMDIEKSSVVEKQSINFSNVLRRSEDTAENIEDEYKSVLSWLKDQPPLTSEQLADLFITMPDFEEALKQVQPSAKREGFATIPDVTWDDIGALKDVREELQMAILAPVRHPEQFRALGLTSPPGILLAGPPGCGKTLLAKAVANESGVNFISVKGPELLNMYVGESERAVRQVFQRARNSSPCVIFFDELDALCPRRSDSGEGGSSVRVVNQLLTEMDGLEERKQVFIMGATNRPDIIDPAILRPGRLDKQLYVGLPTASDRLDILRTITKNGTKPKLADDVDLEHVANENSCQGYTGADLAALIREASVTALKEYMMSGVTTGIPVIHYTHFTKAFTKMKPSVTAKDQKIYAKMKDRISTE